MTHKEKLIAAINSDYLSEEVCELLLSLSQPNLNKGDLMKIVYGPDMGGKVDSAFPMEYGNRMKDLNPNFRYQFMVYDYNEPHRWGAFENVAERAIIKLQNLINQ